MLIFISCKNEIVIWNSVFGGILPILMFIMSLLSESIDPIAACLPSFFAFSYYLLASSFYFTIPSSLILLNSASNLYIDDSGLIGSE